MHFLSKCVLDRVVFEKLLLSDFRLQKVVFYEVFHLVDVLDHHFEYLGPFWLVTLVNLCEVTRHAFLWLAVVFPCRYILLGFFVLLHLVDYVNDF